jgi:hypothetical protein
MRTRIATHIRGNLVGYLALFVALGGSSAWAVNGPLAGKNTVRSAAIVNGQVKRVDLARNAVTSVKVANGSLTRADFARGVLARGGGVVGPRGPAGPQGPPGPAGSGGSGAPSGHAGGDLAGTYPDPTIKPNAVGSAEVVDNSLTAADLGVGSVTSSEVADNSLSGADVNEGTLAQVPSALLGGLGRAASGHLFGTGVSECTPHSDNRFLTCVGVPVVLPSRTRVLLLGRITGLPRRKSNELAACRLATNLSGVPGSSVVFQGNLNTDYEVEGTLIGVTPLVGPGKVNFTIDCVQKLVGVESFSFRDAAIAAVALSPS